MNDETGGIITLIFIILSVGALYAAYRYMDDKHNNRFNN